MPSCLGHCWNLSSSGDPVCVHEKVWWGYEHANPKSQITGTVKGEIAEDISWFIDNTLHLFCILQLST